MDADAPLLEASRARIDAAGIAAVDGLSLRTTAARVVVLGSPRALFAAASGVVPLAHGALMVRGRAPLVAVRAGLLAGAPLDAPMPPSWTVREYVSWSARLAATPGAPGWEAAVNDAIARMELGAVTSTRLGKASGDLRRATAIAAALATSAPVVLLEDPLGSLEADGARGLARAAASALEGRAWVLFTPRAALGSPLTRSAEEALLVVGSEIVAQGAPRDLAARERRYAAEVHGDAAALATLLEASGATVTTPDGGASSRAGVRGARRMIVELAPTQTTRDLLARAEEAGAAIVDLRPLARAFA